MEQPLLAGVTGANLDAVVTPFINRTMESNELVGLAVGIVENNQIEYAKGFGVQHIATHQPVTRTTLFHMASISKPFVATGIMQLHEQGKLQIEAPIIAYLPDFKLADERYREITIQQMLSHISGMPDVDDYEWDHPQYDDDALARYASSLTDKKLLFLPGSRFAYSNMAFECLGCVIAKVSGLTFDDYMKENILNPAGMVDSTFLKPPFLPENWSSPHVRVLDRFAWAGYPYNRRHAPSSTLHASAQEMCRWAIANLNRGVYQDHRILQSSSYDLLWQPRAKVNDTRQVGLSWFLGEYRGEKMVSHGGGDTGFETHFILLPGRQTAVVVLSNLIPSPVKAISNAILDILLGFEPLPIQAHASLDVCKILRQQGVDAAIDHWNALQSTQPNRCIDALHQFEDLLFQALSLEMVPEAEILAHLCTKILPESDLVVLQENFIHIHGMAAKAVMHVLHAPR